MFFKEPLYTVMQFKMRRQLHLEEDAVFRFGIRNSREPEGWSPGIRFLDDGSSFDCEEEKLGWLRIFRHREFFRKTQ